MIHYNPDEISHRDFHQILLSGVAPRPIAFVSTVNALGEVNLAPFSFFNAFGSKPPVVAIGPAIAAATGREKDTLVNILETGECTISTVSYSFVHQMNLASTDYARGVDEYVKSGLTKATSDLVRAPYVAESKFSMECQLIQNVELFREIGGNGNCTFLRVLRVHVREDAMTDDKIDPRKMDFVARMGYKWYAHILPEVCFEAAQPRVRGIGIDQLPKHIRESHFLCGNDLAKLGSVASIPEVRMDFDALNAVRKCESQATKEQSRISEELVRELASTGSPTDVLRTKLCKFLLEFDMIDDAWQCING